MSCYSFEEPEIDILKIVDKKSKWLIHQSTMSITTFFHENHESFILNLLM